MDDMQQMEPFHPYERSMSPLVALWSLIAGGLLLVFMIAGIWAAWSTFVSRASIVIGVLSIVAIVVIPVVGITIIVAVVRKKVKEALHHDELAKLDVQLRTEQVKSVAVANHLKLRTLNFDDQGNSAVIDTISGQIQQLRGNMREFPNLTTYHNAPKITGVTEEAVQVPLALPAARGPVMFKLSALLAQQEIRAQEDESIVGLVETNEQWEFVRGRMFASEGNFFNSLMMFGDQGGGKSAGAVYFAALTVLNGGHLLVIDPDHETAQSLTNRLGPLACAPFLLADVGKDPASALQVLEMAERELNAPGDYPVAFIVDEATMIFRHIANKGTWQEVGNRLSDVGEDYSTRGRKRRRRLMLLGQAPQARRSGETTLRDNLDILCFKLKRKKATLLFQGEDTTLVELSTTLNPGQAVVIPDRAPDDYYTLQLPYADEEGLQHIVSLATQRYGDMRPMRPDEKRLDRVVDARTQTLPERAEGGLNEDLENYYARTEQPLEPRQDEAHRAYGARIDDYPRMTDTQAKLFVTAYTCTGNKDESLKLAGVNSRYRQHANSIIAERKLKKEA